MNAFQAAAQMPDFEQEKSAETYQGKQGILLMPRRAVGIVGYGAYVPMYRLPAKEVARVWGASDEGLPIKEKAVAGLDEDVITMSIEAARNALARAQLDPQKLRAVWIGSESHPYAVKPSGTVVAEAIGASKNISAGDWEFACKAGTEAFVAGMGMVGSEMGEYAMAIGMDTAQGKPGDALEYTAACGGAAYIIGPAEEALARIEAAYSFVDDTPDFWRRPHAIYPEHGQRFTGEPAYFEHVGSAARLIMQETGLKPADFDYVVFHQPNTKFPQRIGKELGFSPEQIRLGLLSPVIGNTYSGAAMIGLTAILDEAEPGQKILMVSYGSGAGSDAFVLETTAALKERQGLAKKTQNYIARRVEIDYATYARYRGEIVVK
jgi:hydroxymethylglutaryl-CoA synthase